MRGPNVPRCQSNRYWTDPSTNCQSLSLSLSLAIRRLECPRLTLPAFDRFLCARYISGRKREIFQHRFRSINAFPGEREGSCAFFRATKIRLPLLPLPPLLGRRRAEAAFQPSDDSGFNSIPADCSPPTDRFASFSRCAPTPQLFRRVYRRAPT